MTLQDFIEDLILRYSFHYTLLHCLIKGSIFTSVGVLEIVASLIGNVTTSAVYAETVSIMRGLVFLVLGSYNALAFLLAG